MLPSSHLSLCRGLPREFPSSARYAAPCNRRNNIDGIAVLRRRVFLRQIADVLSVDIYVYETSQRPFLREQMSLEVRILSGQMTEGFRDGLRLKLSGSLSAGVRPKRRWNHHFDRHGPYLSFELGLHRSLRVNLDSLLRVL